MKRRYMYFADPRRQFSNEARAEIAKYLGDKAPQFIQEMETAAINYYGGVLAEIPPKEFKAKRDAIAKLAAAVSEAAHIMRTLDDDCCDWLHQAYAAEGLLLKTIKSAVAAEQLHLDRLGRICDRVLASNPCAPEGAAVDTDKHGLSKWCAAAYHLVTGESGKQMRSHRGRFVKVLLIVLKAAGAIPASRKTINAKLLMEACPGDVTESQAP